MSDRIGNIAPPRGGTDLTRTVERAGAVARVEKQRETAEPEPRAKPTEVVASAPVDAIALGEARDQIAAVLARADAVEESVAPTPIPLAPGADRDAIAAAQALAQLIAANARPALAAQARLGAAVVRTVIGD